MDRNGGIKGNIIGALIIAAIGCMMYFMQVQQNPITGEKQHISLSPTQEIHLGLQAAPGMSEQMGGELSSSDPYQIEVERMGTFLVSHTVAKNSPWKFKFHVLRDNKTINAFALPGGQVFITMGLLNKLQNEAQLAGVLCHEMGHVIERHSAEQMAKSQLGQSLIYAVGVGSSDSLNHGSAMSATMIASVINRMISLRYSRKDESEADIWGLKLMIQAGYNPKAMIEVMRILKEAAHGGNSIEMFQTHPNPDLRIKNIHDYLQTHPVTDQSTDGKNLKDVFNHL
jgi:predicted Zn-dependent protease